MEENLPAQEPAKEDVITTVNAKPAKEKVERPEVITVRNWKEYLGESLLIIFSVVLALGLTEYFTSLHEKKQAKEILHQLKEELIQNKEDAASQYDYHQQVFKLIDSAKNNAAFARQFLDSGKLHFSVLIPGVLYFMT